MYGTFSSVYKATQTELKSSSVASPSAAWQRMSQFWDLIEDLNAGTIKVRKEHRKYLPQFSREEDASYDVRLSKSTLVPFTQRIEKMLSGMLVRKPIRLDNVSELITTQLFDVNLEGDNLDVYLYQIAKIAIAYGHVGVLVDAPKEGDGRPYWVTYHPKDILGWKTQIIDGQRKLTQLRLLETIVEDDGKYGEKTIQQVRVLEPGSFEIHRKKDEGDFFIYDSGSMSLDEIPFSVAYSNRVGLFESRSPLYDIAELNIKHYQIQSDLDMLLSISAIPLLTFFGFPASADEISAGPGEALSLPLEARAEYISPSADSFDSQFRRLNDIQEQINTLSLSAVLGQKLVGESAEAKRIDRSQNDSTMMVVAQQMQDLIDNCLRFHAMYLNEATAGNCFVNRDFVSTRLQPQEIQGLLQLYTAGTITQETLLKQLESGEVLAEIDVEDELEQTSKGGLIEMNPPINDESEEEVDVA